MSRTLVGVEQIRSTPTALGQSVLAPSVDGDGRTLEGYAALYGVETLIGDRNGDFHELFRKGAFAVSLRQSTPVLQFDHGRSPSVGSLPIGRIVIAEEDSRGLYVQARLSDSTAVEPIRVAIQDGSLRGMSIRFTVPDGGEQWQGRAGKPDLRTIVAADLAELGPVTFPAVRGTSLGVRHDGRQRLRNHERLIEMGILPPDSPAANAAPASSQGRMTPAQRRNALLIAGIIKP